MITASDPLIGSPYQGYSYAYPHKTAYRVLEPAVSLEELWAGEPRDALFLYIHVPFCEMRCAFCNLFTQAKPRTTLVAEYLDALQRQAIQVERSLGSRQFARFAIGGGTPTQLETTDLVRLCDLAERIMGADLPAIHGSVEASPETTTREKLKLLAERGVTRLSLGVQTFIESEARAVGRPQETRRVVAAIEAIRASGFPTMNLDLIYGLPGQTVASWLDTLRQALDFRPEELYLYPLYIRPLTGLGRSDREWDDIRLRCYREARALLREEGYEQVSMRMFRAAHAPAEAGPIYCCQTDGMVGLGCGARSYARALHYSTEYAVGARGVRELIAAYNARPDSAFGFADYGFQLDEDEQRRRYLIQSLLTRDGLDAEAYLLRFHRMPAADYPQLRELVDRELAEVDGQRWRLTEEGLELSDAIGPWLYSPAVQRRTEDYTWR